MRFGVRQGNRHVKCRFHRFAFRSAPSSPYDVENRLLTSAPNLKLVYDPEGRLAKYSSDNGSTWTQFAYDGTNLIAEYNNSGVLQRRYIYGPGTDEVVAWIETGRGSANVHYMVANYQGSNRHSGFRRPSGIGLPCTAPTANPRRPAEAQPAKLYQRLVGCILFGSGIKPLRPLWSQADVVKRRFRTAY
ncbi:MAG: hypothetical protein WDN06_08985 [Asticcacaulis sp.]